MAYCLFGTKPLPEPMLTYCQLDPRDKLQWNSNQDANIYIDENIFENVVGEMARGGLVNLTPSKPFRKT